MHRRKGSILPHRSEEDGGHRRFHRGRTDIERRGQRIGREGAGGNRNRLFNIRRLLNGRRLRRGGRFHRGDRHAEVDRGLRRFRCLWLDGLLRLRRLGRGLNGGSRGTDRFLRGKQRNRRLRVLGEVIVHVRLGTRNRRRGGQKIICVFGRALRFCRLRRNGGRSRGGRCGWQGGSGGCIFSRRRCGWSVRRW